jgi:hypothetical protein
VFGWIDGHPWWSIAIFFAAGALVGVVLRRLRRAKYVHDAAPPPHEAAA